MPKHHIVVGDGITAAEFAVTSPCQPGDTLTIIGPKVTHLGRGLAYASAPKNAPWKYAYLLNSPARSVDTDFSNWLKDNWENLIVPRMNDRQPDWLSAAEHYVQIDQIASLNAPREFFGDFLHEQTMEKLAALTQAGVQVRTLSASVTEISVANTGLDTEHLQVHTDDGQCYSADKVDVAVGGALNQRIRGDNSENSFPELFGNENAIMQKLAPRYAGLDNANQRNFNSQSTGANTTDVNSSCIAIGSRAAMLDLLRFYQSIQPENEINLLVLSPSGAPLPALIPADTFTPAHYALKEQFDTAEEFIDAIKVLQKIALAAGHNFYETRVGLRALFSNKCVNDFVRNSIEARKVANPLFKHFEGGTRDSIADFHRLAQSGNIQCIAGHVNVIEQSDNGVSVSYTDKSGKLNTVNATVSVNCTGFGNARTFDTLTTSILEQGWIANCDQSGGIIVGEGCKTTVPGLRYLSPAVTSIGKTALQVPLYDAHRLRTTVQTINGNT